MRSLLLLLLMAAPAAAQSRLVFAWNENPLNAGWPPCSKLVVRKCRTGYTLTDVTKAMVPVVVSSTIAQDASAYTLTPLPVPGVHIYSLTINARGTSGIGIQSVAATVRVDVPRASQRTKMKSSHRQK